VRNVTFRIDEETLRRARIRALERGTSLNAVVEEFLATWSSADQADARRRLVELAERHGTHADLDERAWSRDDLYEERTRWPRS
jgi:hypothetical protein